MISQKLKQHLAKFNLSGIIKEQGVIPNLNKAKNPSTKINQSEEWQNLPTIQKQFWLAGDRGGEDAFLEHREAMSIYLKKISLNSKDTNK